MLSTNQVNLDERMLGETLFVVDTKIMNLRTYHFTSWLLLLLEFSHCLVIYALSPPHNNLNLDSARLRH